MHLHFYLRGVTDGIRPHWKLPADFVRKSLLEVVNVAWKLENAVQPVVGLGFHPPTTKDVDHEALWLAFVMKVQFWLNRVASNIVFQPFKKMRAELCGQERSLWQPRSWLPNRFAVAPPMRPSEKSGSGFEPRNWSPFLSRYVAER